MFLNLTLTLPPKTNQTSKATKIIKTDLSIIRIIAITTVTTIDLTIIIGTIIIQAIMIETKVKWSMKINKRNQTDLFLAQLALLRIETNHKEKKVYLDKKKKKGPTT